MAFSAFPRCRNPAVRLLPQWLEKTRAFAACLLLGIASLNAGAQAPFLYSRSAVVYDVAHGQALLEKNPDEPAPLASLTKLMTSMVVLDQHPALDEALTVDAGDIDRLKHSSSRIPVGTTLARMEMLRLALMSSENRSASALSRGMAGGHSAFVGTMNGKASALGMTGTHFEDATGLSPQNISTARDVARMAEAASRYPLIHEFTTLSGYGVEVNGRLLHYHNSSPVLGRPGWDVLLSKTGFINEAGYCIALEVNVQNSPVIIVLMGATSHRRRMADLVSIRSWLQGEPAPSAALLQAAYYPGRPFHHHRARAVPHHGRFRLASYPAKPAAKIHGPGARHKAGRRNEGRVLRS